MKILARLSIVAAIALSTCFLSTELHAQKKTVRRVKKAPINYLLRGSIALPNRIHAIPFIIGMSGGTVAGRFEARGGSNNDLFCYIVDSDGYINLRNGNQAQTFYNSSEYAEARKARANACIMRMLMIEGV